MAACVRANKITKWLQSMIFSAAPHAMSRNSSRSAGFCTTKKRQGSSPNELGDRRAVSKI